MGGLLNAIPLPWRLAGAALVIAAAAGFVLWREHEAYSRGWTEASVECQRRADEQERKIDEVWRAAEAEQDRLTDALRMLQKDNQNAKDRIAEAAAADPHGADVCLGPDIMRDLGTIR